MKIFAPKEPGATEKFEFDFTGRLGADSIAGDATLTADGVTLGAHTLTGGKVDFLLSGGTQGTVAKVTCVIATSGGETLSELGVVPIGGEAVDLATAKAAQKIEDDSEDALLAGFLRAAIRAVERRTGKNLTQQVETQVVDAFPGGYYPAGAPGLGCGGAPGGANHAIRLHKGPVSEILEVAYDDSDGVAQTLADFRLVEGVSARLLPAFNASWPVTAFGPGTVRVSYVAGYDPADRDLAALTQAAILLFGHFNANREAVIASERAAAVELPLGIEYLLQPYCSVGIA